MPRLRSLVTVAATISGLAAGAAGAQPPAVAQPIVAADAPAPASPSLHPAAQWTAAATRQLLAAIAAAPAEGLDPAPYRADLVRAALADGEGPALDAVASTAALALANDYYDGRVADKARFDWHIERSADLATQLPAQLDGAVAAGDVRGWLDGLLPQNADYRALRAALADARDRASRGRLRANLERWRWMPRALGDKYLYVNVPSYTLDVVDGGATVATYTVVVGAPKTPTPMLALTAQSLVVNPWWTVPQSIVKSSNLRPGHGGYMFERTADGGYAVRQPPGARNALGKVKIDMPNEQAIYLHDTPAKAGFAKADRALSHGCIRVKDIDRLAAELVADGGGDAARFEDAYAGGDTQTLRLATQWPVYLVYFTAAADGDGGIRALPDPYGRDAPLLAALDSRVMVASR